jgi:hypothetical protein
VKTHPLIGKFMSWQSTNSGADNGIIDDVLPDGTFCINVMGPLADDEKIYFRELISPHHPGIVSLLYFDTPELFELWLSGPAYGEDEGDSEITGPRSSARH